MNNAHEQLPEELSLQEVKEKYHPGPYTITSDKLIQLLQNQAVLGRELNNGWVVNKTSLDAYLVREDGGIFGPPHSGPPRPPMPTLNEEFL